MSKLDDAIRFAIEAHSGQVRKLSKNPYILHPLEAMTICATITTEEDVLCAAVLHDVVEDGNRSLDEISDKFGTRVAELVSTETENKRRELPASITWRLRKEETLEMLKNAQDFGVKIMWIGDKLSNVRSFYDAYLKQGDAFWNMFNQKDKKEQAWYYREIYNALKPHFQGTLVFQEFEQILYELFGKGEILK